MTDPDQVPVQRRTLGERDVHLLRTLLARSEDWLTDRVMELARERGYDRHGANSREPLKFAVAGVTASIMAALQTTHRIPELDVDIDAASDPIGRFGVLEARRHRRRGVTLDLFLGLFKYFRTSYFELIDGAGFVDRLTVIRYVGRVFDRIEVAYVHEWTEASVEQELRAQQAANREMVREKVRLWTLIENLPIPAMVVDPDGSLVMLNRAGEPLFDDRDTSDTDAPPAWLAGLLSCFRDRGPDMPTEPCDVVVTTRTGPRTFSAIVSAMIDVANEFEGYAIAMLDITQRLATESALRAALNDLQVAHNAVVQAQRLEAIGELAAGVAHEINTPIQFVGDNLRFLQTSFGELLELVDLVGDAQRESPLPPPDLFDRLADLAQEIDLDYLRPEIPLAIGQSLDGVERVAQIVRALKGVAHPDSDAPAAADVNDIVRNVAIITRNEWKYSSTLDVELEPDLPIVTCFAGPLGQVLVNLIVNAVAAIVERQQGDPDHRGVITLRTSRPADGSVRVAVTDNGTGIPAEVLPRIFDPFFTTKKFGQGTGQGLAIAYAVVVNHHGGSIEVQTERGVGSTFTIDLPLEPHGADTALALTDVATR